MFNNKYLIRLDDACPFMDSKKWQRMENLLDNYGLKPLVGIIPDNADSKTMMESENSLFWDKAKMWQEKGWSIALHGYDHCYLSDKGMNGFNPMWSRSEYAGVSLEKQKEKIRKGVGILKEHGLIVNYFFAPSHTFDKNTLKALMSESDIRIVSDTIGRFPYKYQEFWFIPQITGHCVKMPLSGIYTFCFHPNMMVEHDFVVLESFIKDYQNSFITFDEINLELYGSKRFADKVLTYLFFKYRKFRKLR